MKFNEFGLNQAVMDGLESMNFIEATPIQEQTIPAIISGKDVIGCAQTGTGKTAAYCLPLLHSLLTDHHDEHKITSIVMAPTRELAQQIDMQFEGFSYFMPISTVAIYGGGDGSIWEQQKQGLLSGADVVIATPGRLITHMDMYDIDMSGVKYFILDEADRMLDMGFYDDIMKIVNKLPKERQTIMFSATMPAKIRQMANTVLVDPVEIKIAVSKPNEAITQQAYVCHEEQKMGLIEEIFSKHPVTYKSIIFSSSKQKVKDLAHILKRMKFNVAAMHSDLEQAEREKVMLDFKNNKTNILVATDIVSRGIDIDDIGMVLNFDVPHDPEDYIHRIGRTARANAEGLAITFISDKEQGKFGRIEHFIEREVEKLPIPAALGNAPAYTPGSGDSDRRHSSHRRRDDRRPRSNNGRDNRNAAPRNGEGPRTNEGQPRDSRRPSRPYNPNRRRSSDTSQGSGQNAN